MLAAFVVFSIHAGKKPRSSWAGRLVLELVGPVQRLVTAAGDSASRLWQRYFYLVHAAGDNQRLKAQVARMRQELTDLEELKLANQRLRRLLGLKDKLSYPVVACEVVAVDPSSHFRNAIIDKGRKEGVLPLMPVVQAQGVVGRVVWSSPHYAKVLLLTDPNAAVDVLVQRSRARGVVEGAGPRRLRLKYVLRNYDLTVGDRLITSGAAGVFPKGILVGTVRSVRKEAKEVFQDVEVEPAVDFARLEEVLVILHRRDFPE